MNKHVRLPPVPSAVIDATRAGPTTLAAEGLPRRAFTIDDVEKMMEVGILGPKERIELVGGELVPMSPKGYHHEILKSRLTRHLTKAIPDDQELVTETSYYLTPTWTLEPDLVVYPRGGLKTLDGSTVLLVVEIADSSLVYDLKRKAAFYSEFGVREYWVINATKLVTTRHLGPTADGYTAVTEHAEHESLVPHLAPALAVALAQLDLAAET